MVWVMVVLELYGMDSVELGMKDIEGNIEAIVDFSHKALANLVAKIVFGIGMVKVSKERVCSSYFEMGVHNL